MLYPVPPQQLAVASDRNRVPSGPNERKFGANLTCVGKPSWALAEQQGCPLPTIVLMMPSALTRSRRPSSVSEKTSDPSDPGATDFTVNGVAINAGPPSPV